jgi:hypothetical protein
MPLLIPAIVEAAKIGSKALGSIVSKSKAKKAERKTLRLQQKASEKEAALNSVASKIGLVKPQPRLTTGDISSVNTKRDYKNLVKVNEKAMDMVQPVQGESGFNKKMIAAVVAIVLLILILFVKRKR